MINAAIYTRISKDSLGLGLGVSRQQADCEKLARSRGWKVAKDAVFQDNDTSAAGKVKRRGFEAMLAGLLDGRYSVVIAWNLDRLTRNRKDTVRLIETAQQVGATISVVRGSDLDMSTPAGRMTADILASVARNEIEVKGERQQAANRQAAAEGKPYWHRRPFGYTLPRREGAGYVPPRIVEDEADGIRWACEQVLAGETLAAITRRWNENGLYTPQTKTGGIGNRPWTTQGVRRVLMRPGIAGLLDFKEAWQRSGGKDGALVPAQWDAIVPEETWRAVRGVLMAPGRGAGRPPTGRHPTRILAGWGTCGVCGGKLNVDRSRGKPAYRCTRNRCMCRQAEYAERWVVEQLMLVLVWGDLSAAVDLDSDQRTTDLRMRRGALMAKFAEYTPEVIAAIGGKSAAAAMGLLRAQLDEIEDELAKSSNAALVADVWGVGGRSDLFWERWNGLSIARQQSTLRYFFEKVVLPPGKDSPVEMIPTPVGQRVIDLMLPIPPDEPPDGPGPDLDIRDNGDGTKTLRRRLE